MLKVEFYCHCWTNGIRWSSELELLLETTWKQARNETLKVHEMKQLY
jgi:hypothetical protein